MGKHRPDFLARCGPMLNGTPLTQDRPLQLWTIDVCTQTDKHTLKDGMRSFPSGHASSKFNFQLSVFNFIIIIVIVNQCRLSWVLLTITLWNSWNVAGFFTPHTTDPSFGLNCGTHRLSTNLPTLSPLNSLYLAVNALMSWFRTSR